jgi:hypothetical protein
MEVTEDSTRPPIEFPLESNSPQARALALFFAIASISGLLASLALFGLEIVSWDVALFAILFCILFPAAGIWNARLIARGFITLDSTGLTVRTHAWTHSYDWSDIADVEMVSFAQRGAANRAWARLLGWQAEKPFIELRLKRSVRLGLRPARYGTRLLGIPLLFGKGIPLFLADPQSLRAIANSYLGASRG